MNTVQYAKTECVKNQSCIGIEIRDGLYGRICMNTFCASRDLFDDGNSTISFFKKKERYGKQKYYNSLVTLYLEYISGCR